MQDCSYPPWPIIGLGQLRGIKESPTARAKTLACPGMFSFKVLPEVFLHNLTGSGGPYRKSDGIATQSLQAPVTVSQVSLSPDQFSLRILRDGIGMIWKSSINCL